MAWGARLKTDRRDDAIRRALHAGLNARPYEPDDDQLIVEVDESSRARAEASILEATGCYLREIVVTSPIASMLTPAESAEWGRGR